MQRFRHRQLSRSISACFGRVPLTPLPRSFPVVPSSLVSLASTARSASLTALVALFVVTTMMDAKAQSAGTASTEVVAAAASTAVSTTSPAATTPMTATVRPVTATPAFSAYAMPAPALTSPSGPTAPGHHAATAATAGATMTVSSSVAAASPAVTAGSPTAPLVASASGTAATASITPPTSSTSASAAGAATPAKDTPLVGVVAEVAAEAPPTDLWDRIRAGYSMEDLEDPLVTKWEKFYADRPEYMARIVERSSKYMFYIVTELERRGMPLEIALLPMIESAFNPVAYSTAKAAGIWQFIPSTGVNYGMKQDWWADSRRDIVAATNGALDYLAKLHGMFGDWQLALASYNWGEGSVGRAVGRSKARGKDGTYLSLDMPAETRNYLPKLQAVKNIIRNPGAFGLTIASIPNEPYFKTITLANPIDLKRAAQLAEMTETDFVALNPAHNRPVIGGRSEYQVLLPADKADTFLARLEANEKPRVSWMAYRTRPGDRVEALAERFGTTASALKAVNGIRSPASALPAGYHLLVPSDGPSEDALGSIQNAVFTKFPEYTAPRAHKVRKGETFAGIAKRYGVKPATLAQWNRMGKQSVRAGQTLYVSGPAPVRQLASKGGRVVQVKRNAKTVRHAAPAKRGVVKKRR